MDPSPLCVLSSTLFNSDSVTRGLGSGRTPILPCPSGTESNGNDIDLLHNQHQENRTRKVQNQDSHPSTPRPPPGWDGGPRFLREKTPYRLESFPNPFLSYVRTVGAKRPDALADRPSATLTPDTVSRTVEWTQKVRVTGQRKGGGAVKEVRRGPQRKERVCDEPSLDVSTGEVSTTSRRDRRGRTSSWKYQAPVRVVVQSHDSVSDPTTCVNG